MTAYFQTLKEAEVWVRQFHVIADSLTTTDLHKFYTKDSELQYANQELLVGLESIVKFFDGVFPLLESMKHEIVSLDLTETKIFQACTISYVVKNDPENKLIKIPAMGVFHSVGEGEKEESCAILRRFDVYLDPREVFARIGEVGGKK